MTAQSIVQALHNMTVLQKSLTALAKQKTQIIIKGDVKAIQSLMKEENKHIQAIRKVESNLMQETTLFLQNNSLKLESPKLSDAIEIAEAADKEKLMNGKKELENQICELSKLNQTNQELLKQSLQFVNISLDLLQPDLDSYNYDRDEQMRPQSGNQGRSLFDSKA